MKRVPGLTIEFIYYHIILRPQIYQIYKSIVYSSPLPEMAASEGGAGEERADVSFPELCVWANMREERGGEHLIRKDCWLIFNSR